MWKGAGWGVILFLVIAAAGALTPLRIPLLKVAGRDYAALQFQKQTAEAGLARPQVQASPEHARVEARVDVRLEAWHKRNETLSVFGLLGWLMDLWPWLLGLGVALPVLGGLIGAQPRAVRATRGTHRAEPRLPDQDPGLNRASHRASTAAEAPAPLPPDALSFAEPVVESPSASPSPAASVEPPPPLHAVVATGESAGETPVVPATPAAPATPLPPSEWSWNARPAPRTTPGRPKPPPVESPNADAV